jgi:hypothetical protein
VDFEATPVFVGRVWMNGDPWLVADRADAETWTGTDGDYERITALATFDTVVSVGDASGLVLSSDYDDSTIEVFRVAADALLSSEFATQTTRRTRCSWPTPSKSTSRSLGRSR